MVWLMYQPELSAVVRSQALSGVTGKMATIATK